MVISWPSSEYQSTERQFTSAQSFPSHYFKPCQIVTHMSLHIDSIQSFTKCSFKCQLISLVFKSSKTFILFFTGKSFLEALIPASTNPQYDKRLFIESRDQYMKISSSKHVVYTNCFVFVFLTFRTVYEHNMFWA